MPEEEPEFRPTRYKAWNPDGGGRHELRPIREHQMVKPTRAQAVVEIVLFVMFGLLVTLAAIALYTTSSPKHKIVTNTVADGFRRDRINILLFGFGGENHPRKDQLADSIMLVSLKPSTKQAAIVSVPRDLWVRVGPYGTHRINYAHSIGNDSGYPGEGPGLLCDTVSKTFGQPVDAFVRVDFSAFEKLIDRIGGVDVYCQRGFYDFLFHDGFSRGWHHLDGKRALAYARYRYVVGPEGDNFAREMRQQQVVNAVRAKLQRLSPQAAFNILAAAQTLSAATETNLTPSQMVSLYRAFHDIPQSNIRHVSLKPLTEVFEVTRLAEAGEAVRIPSSDFAQVRNVESRIFDSNRQISTSDEIQFAKLPPAQPQSMLSAVQQ